MAPFESVPFLDLVSPHRELEEDLVAAFRDGTLPRAEWTHVAHLRVGAWHVHRHGAAMALELLRDGIRRLNDRHGTVNSDTSG